MAARRLPTGGFYAVEPVSLSDGTTAYALRIVPANADGSDAPTGSAAAPYSTQAAPLPAGTDRSGTTSSTANTSTTLAPANTARRGLKIQNMATTGDLYVNEFGGTASNTAGSNRIATGASFRIDTNRQVTVAGSAASMPYTATEF